MPEEIIKLCDLNLSGLNPEKIIKLFWTLIKNTKDKQEYVTFICQHTVKYIKNNNNQSLEFINEDCQQCRINRQLKIKKKYQLVGVLFYLMGGLQEQNNDIYALAKQKFESLLGIFEDRQQFSSYCSIINEKSLKNNYHDPNKLISPYEVIKFKKYPLIIVDSCKGFLSNNKNQDEFIMVKSFENFLNQFIEFTSSNNIINFNPCLHNIYLGQLEEKDKIQKFKINIFNTNCTCQKWGFPILFFSYITGKNYEQKYQSYQDQDDFDVSPLLKEILVLIKENMEDPKDIDDQVQVLQEIFQKYQQNQNNNPNQQMILQTRYPIKQYKISFFAFQISQILITLDETRLWEGYKIYVLQDLIEMVENEILEKNLFEDIENEIIVRATNHQNFLQSSRQQQIERIVQFNKNSRKHYFRDIIEYYDNSLGQKVQFDIQKFSLKIQQRFNYFNLIKNLEKPMIISIPILVESYEELIKRRNNYQQLNLQLVSQSISRQNSLSQNQRNQQLLQMESVISGSINESIHQSQQLSSKVIFRQSNEYI